MDLAWESFLISLWAVLLCVADPLVAAESQLNQQVGPSLDVDCSVQWLSPLKWINKNQSQSLQIVSQTTIGSQI